MKKYRITVNGKSYEVEVEDIGGSKVNSTANESVVLPSKNSNLPSTPVPKPAFVESQPKKTEPSKAVPQGGETIEAPMPGTILDIKVNDGESVEEGQVLLILEAMKMENEIVAPRAGKVIAIITTNGASVNAGDPLVSLE